MQPTDLRCEYLRNPLGIDVTAPRLSWMLTPSNDHARGLKQTGYRIIVASTPERLRTGHGDLWDSGTVHSDESIQVVYRGKPLSSGGSAWWQVRVWNQAGVASPWSETASWSFGLQFPDWKARWIGLDEKQAPKDRVLSARMLRKEFDIPAKPKSAYIYLSGVGSSELYVNGSKISDAVLSPGLTDYTKRVLYVTYDVTKYLNAGRNVLGLMLGNGRFFGPESNMTVTYGYPKAIVQLEVKFPDGSETRVISDSSWKVTTNGPIRANNEYDGEEYDARMEINGWTRPGFDDSRWQPAPEIQGPPGVLRAQMAAPLRVTETIRPVAMSQHAGAYIFDMGQNMVGWCRLTVSGPSGTRVTLRFAETLTSYGALYTANLRAAKATDAYILKGDGVETWEPRFTYHGFRYVELDGFPGIPSMQTLEGRVVHDDLDRIADFDSSSELLNKIHRNIFWGLRGNYRSIPTDCPQRDERQGWLGDRSQVQRTEPFFFDVAAFYTKWLADIADSQWPDGSVPSVAPAYWPFYNDNVTWPSTFVFLPGMLYDFYGDRRPIEQYYPALKKWMEHMGRYLENGLLAKDVYGDWCVPPESLTLIHSVDPARKTDGALIATAYYYELLKQMERYARLLKRPDEASSFAAQAVVISKAFQAKFYKPDRGIYENGTQTSSILPLAFGLVPPEDVRAVLDALVHKISVQSNNHIGVGLVGAQWLLRTLSDYGYPDIAYAITTQKTYPGWGYMVERGATTMWELWNGDTADPSMNSGNHVMLIGDLGVWMYEYLAGIRPDPEHPGFKHIVIRPCLTGDLGFVKASHRSPYGAIATRWKRIGTELHIDVTIPPGSTATIYVPSKAGGSVTESGHPATAASNVRFLKTDETHAIYEIGSGTYSFISTP